MTCLIALKKSDSVEYKTHNKVRASFEYVKVNRLLFAKVNSSHGHTFVKKRLSILN